MKSIQYVLLNLICITNLITLCLKILIFFLLEKKRDKNSQRITDLIDEYSEENNSIETKQVSKCKYWKLY